MCFELGSEYNWQGIQRRNRHLAVTEFRIKPVWIQLKDSSAVADVVRFVSGYRRLEGHHCFQHSGKAE
jgi:hypothetical protein